MWMGADVVLPIYHSGKFSWDEALVLLIIMAAVPLFTWFRGRRESGVRPPATPPPASPPDDTPA